MAMFLATNYGNQLWPMCKIPSNMLKLQVIYVHNHPDTLSSLFDLQRQREVIVPAMKVGLKGIIFSVTLLHYGSFPFTSVLCSESRPSSRGIFVT